MNIIYTDVLVIGGGLAGLRTAIGVKRRGLDTLILSLVPAKRSHSVAAQGGMQASLANFVKGYGDNEDVHFTDTVRGSDWGCDQIVARMFTHMAPKAVRELAAWGVPWNRVKAGEQKFVIHGEPVNLHSPSQAHGLITARDFGGTKKWRTCYTSDGTGHAMLYTVSDRAIAENIAVHDRKEAMSLIHDGERCHGAIVRDLVTGQLITYLAKATVISTGGYGRIYGVSTNAIINEGMGQALALETGVAKLANLEAVQFHPTAIVPAGILVTEGCRGDGGLLRDVDGYRFMPDYEPEKAELASRDVVSRRMAEHMRKGKGVKSRFGDHLWLDITVLGRKRIDKNLREVKEICQHFLGIDPATDFIPVRPTQHYSMGGIQTNYRGESPNLTGLYACGEAACWDLHGFNRLGGNSVAETVVSGMLVAEYIADFCLSSAGDFSLSTNLAEDFLHKEQSKLQSLMAKRSDESPVSIRKRMETIMTEQVGLFRNAIELQSAVDELRELIKRCENIGVCCGHMSANPELVLAYRLPRMLKIALGVAQGALARTESRGAHYREDYPERNDKDWLNRTLYRWSEDDLKIDYESLDVSGMELPPGFRGYGEKNIVEHPASQERRSELENLQAPTDDRYSSQEKSMPFLHLLPEKYRRKNERLEEPPA